MRPENIFVCLVILAYTFHALRWIVLVLVVAFLIVHIFYSTPTSTPTLLPESTIHVDKF
jgi:hypothetical protein